MPLDIENFSCFAISKCVAVVWLWAKIRNILPCGQHPGIKPLDIVISLVFQPASVLKFCDSGQNRKHFGTYKLWKSDSDNCEFNLSKQKEKKTVKFAE